MHLFSPLNFFDVTNYLHATLFQDCNYVWEIFDHLPDYLKHTQFIHSEANISDKAFLINPEQISLGKGTIVEPGAYIKGPCIIGENCIIRHGAYIRGHLITGNQCVIGHDTEIKNSILLNEVQAAHFAYIGNSILGNRVNLGAGVKCANLKLKKDAINIYHEGQYYETGLRKLGAFIGDGSQIGCNAVTNPGTLLGKNCFLFPCTNFGGVALNESIIRLDAKIQISTRK